ncbi:flippase [Thermococcus peptonophilus]|uniref:Capsular biosynthesis protein n=1 Tax=Thermococcus peptonophilus TaxID=53952 RepID=A0A142CXM6_9EURY|nr:flippase [Thermococcus peptonophilus]AMQ19528.1 capsular biosynthesis protein [Thermococcus peptonophilus]
MKPLERGEETLGKVAKGAGIVLAGTVLGMLLNFLTKAVLARYYERSQYGSFTLTVTVLSIAMTIALLGLQNGLSREIARHLQRDRNVALKLASTGVLIGSSSSLALTVLVFTLAPNLGNVLNDPHLNLVLRIASPALLPMVLTMIIVAISRGHGRVRENFYYRNVLPQLLFLILLLIVLILNLSFNWVFIAYVAAWTIPAFLGFRDGRKFGLLPRRPEFDWDLAKELLAFSFPLMLTGILDYVLGWTDSLMLGYYFGPDKVGLYNGAAPIARALPVVLNSLGFVFMPMATVLFTGRDLKGLKRLYQSTTKWGFILTFPAFLLLFAFPGGTINLFFGPKYTEAVTALRILSLGFMFHVVMGLNAMSLVAVGRTSDNLIGNLLAAVLNIALNAALIPVYGINGAALATASSYIAANLYRVSVLYRTTGVQPFGKAYTKALIIGAVTLVFGVFLGDSGSIPGAILKTAALYGGYFLLVLLSGCIEKEEAKNLEKFAEKVGLNLEWLIRIIERLSKDE